MPVRSVARHGAPSRFAALELWPWRWASAAPFARAFVYAFACACAAVPPGASPAASRAAVAAGPSEPAPALTSEKPTAVERDEAAPGPELPRGGYKLFPDYQLVGFCGTPGGAPALGRLDGNLAQKARAIEGYASKYSGRRKTLPVFELIAVIVQSTPGADGKWRRRVDDAVVERYLRAARDAKALLLLNIQPGWSDFMSEVQHYEKYLAEPEVGVALDPEWAMKPGQKPGRFYGQTTGETIDALAEYLSSIVTRNHLPEKALVFHQVNEYVVQDEASLKPYPGVALINSVDGLGPKGAKVNTYAALIRIKPAAVHPGFKLFFDEDTANGGPMMTPREVLSLLPPPEYVMYE